MIVTVTNVAVVVLITYLLIIGVKVAVSCHHGALPLLSEIILELFYAFLGRACPPGYRQNGKLLRGTNVCTQYMCAQLPVLYTVGRAATVQPISKQTDTELVLSSLTVRALTPVFRGTSVVRYIDCQCVKRFEKNNAS